jgi:hypothetical protein
MFAYHDSPFNNANNAILSTTKENERRLGYVQCSLCSVRCALRLRSLSKKERFFLPMPNPERRVKT